MNISTKFVCYGTIGFTEEDCIVKSLDDNSWKWWQCLVWLFSKGIGTIYHNRDLVWIYKICQKEDNQVKTYFIQLYIYLYKI
jgi:hypothetical protein